MELRTAKIEFIAENAKALTAVEIVVMVREMAQEWPKFYYDRIPYTDVFRLNRQQEFLMALLAELETRGVLRDLEEKLVFDLVG
jgi:hypothetical protein